MISSNKIILLCGWNFVLTCASLMITASFVKDRNGRANAGEPRVEWREKADELIASYSGNRTGFRKFCIAVELETTVHDPVNTQNSGNFTDWYIFSRDEASNSTRFDFADSMSSAGGVASRKGLATLLSVSGKHYEYVNGTKSRDLVVEDPDELASTPLIATVPRFDPWDLPIGFASMLKRNQSIRSSPGSIENILAPLEIAAFRETPTQFVLTYLRSKKHRAYIEYTFDRKLSNLPIRSRSFVSANSPDDRRALVSTVETEWAELKSGNWWVPAIVTIESVEGPRNKRTRKNVEATFYWAMNAEVPQDTFAVEKCMPSFALRDLIVEAHSKKLYFRPRPSER